VDFRLLGFGMRRQSASELSSDLSRWTWTGLIVMLTTGFLMFFRRCHAILRKSVVADQMVFLLSAIVYGIIMQGLMTRLETSPVLGRLAACVSLALWISVLSAGRMIAFV